MLKDEERREDRGVRGAVLSLVRRGLASEAEAARLAGVSRMTVHRWCRAAGLDWQTARDAALARLWRQTVTRRLPR